MWQLLLPLLVCLSLCTPSTGNMALEGGCSLPVTSSRRKFEERYKGQRPILLRGLVKEWPASQHWATKEGFLRRHGDLQVVLREQVVHTVDADGRRVNVSQYLRDSAEHSDLIQFSFEDLTTFRRLAPEYATGGLMPSILRGIHKKPAFSLGKQHTGSGLHKHSEAWLAQMAGRKTWLLAPPGSLSAQEQDVLEQTMPCELLKEVQAGRHPTLQLCTVSPGEVIYLPTQWHHATCNQDEFTLAVGGREDSSAWPPLITHIQAGHEQAVKGEIERLSTPGMHSSHERRALNDPSMLDPLPLHLAARVGPISILDELIKSGLMDPGALRQCIMQRMRGA